VKLHRRSFGDSFEVISDHGVRVAQKDYLNHGHLPVVDQGDGLIGGFTDRVEAEVQGALPLIVFGDHTRRVKYIDFSFAVGAQGTKLLRAQPGLLPKYAYYFLKSVRLEDRGYGRHFALLRRVSVPVPSLSEQYKVVDLLEGYLSHLDAAERSLEFARQRVDRLVLAHLSCQVRWLSDTSAPVAAIGDVAHTNLGKMLDAKRSGGELTPYLGNINVRWGTFDLGDLKQVHLTLEERNRFSLDRGDVLVCEGGEPGRCAVWHLQRSEIAYQKALHRVRVQDPRAVSPHFFALMLREAIQSGRSDSLFTGTTIKHLPQEKLRRIRLPIPSLDVQSRLVAEADRIAEAVNELRRSLADATRLSAALHRSVLAAAFSGKLTGRHTDQAVIEELANV
jgi:restriction endonuclease S subunit